ncbi:MAG: Trm112 family protein [Candidatus Neomarinimicrobiota bacterium]
MALSQELLDILVCPKCKGQLEYQEEKERLVCPACRLAYPIEDDVPIMLIDQAHNLDEYESG